MIYESQKLTNLAGQKCVTFSLNSGAPTRLGKLKKEKIKKALIDRDVDKVYSRGGRLYELLLNGSEKEI